jgi:hypothetical protein
MANDTRVDLPEPTDVRVHPAFKDLISPETFGVYTAGTNARLQIINMVPKGVYHENETPVVSRTVGDGLRNSTTKLRSLGGYYTVYEVIFIKIFEAIIGEQTLKNIMIDINMQLDQYQFNKEKLLDFQDNVYETVAQVDILHVWGAFVFLLVGYVTSVLFRIFFTAKTGLANITLFRHPKRENMRGSMVSRRDSLTSTTAHTANVVLENTHPEIAGNGMVEIELNERHSSITIEV